MSSKYSFSPQKEDGYLLLMFFLIAILISIKSYFNGYLTPDSTEYLALAQNLLEGNGYFISTDQNLDKPINFFEKYSSSFISTKKLVCENLIFFFIKLET